VPGPKLGQLRPSTTGEVQHVEKEDERLVLLERLGKRELVTAGGRQLEFRRFVTNREHEMSLFGLETLQHVPAGPSRPGQDVAGAERFKQRCS
jgi:hypothetical protein